MDGSAAGASQPLIGSGRVRDGVPVVAVQLERRQLDPGVIDGERPLDHRRGTRCRIGMDPGLVEQPGGFGSHDANRIQVVVAGARDGCDPWRDGLPVGDGGRRGDLTLIGPYDPQTGQLVSYEDVARPHGGLGGWQGEPFLLHPSALELEGPLVGALSVHDALRRFALLLPNLV